MNFRLNPLYLLYHLTNIKSNITIIYLKKYPPDESSGFNKIQLLYIYKRDNTFSFPNKQIELAKSGPCIIPVVAILSGIYNIFPRTLASF